MQVRDVPEDVHRTYRRRAATAGMSLQEFVLAELIASARVKTPAEVVAEVEQMITDGSGEGFSSTSSVADVRRARDER